ncbi:putative pyridoxine 5'-phosphate oxidase superfamily flavin-nucleotide-binding protein [Azospirillum fermentarium]|uniref:pyridoxamine 5'-phosphate oxidase family protein n=1 Tax=Azospirillum fermentarium TaxID=1233114 RepID=UPI0022277F32|nr:pyridoxamine 5'-phosphate oxidase family protein [Azospirillum fermentarium]MCW2244870.1 putative pyridoxine 5'-phosphate oxidase superfamily flavin-nucleotide-binding protein [Azospirillum fermentarium]
MAKHHDSITPDLADFIAAQPMFFIATAADEGRVNLSPKGLDGSFAVLDPRRVAFLNLTGSGNETAAHLRLNPRITVMFCSFTAKPLILRLYGTARAVHARDADWADLDRLFPAYAGKRQIVVVEVDDIISSCGFGVPRMAMEEQRPTLPDWAAKKGDDGIRAYWRDKNSVSFDGLPTGILEDA